jgi:hypothetical protein
MASTAQTIIQIHMTALFFFSIPALLEEVALNTIRTVLSVVEAVAYAISGGLWWKGSRIRVPIVQPTWGGIKDVLTLSQSVAVTSRWNKWAAIAAAAGAIFHILGMIFPSE